MDMPARPVRRQLSLRARLSRDWPAALAGTVAAGAAIAVSELVAGLISGAPSLVVSVGSLVISLQPPGAKDFFVSLFGTNDKLALNVLIVIVALAAASAAGVLARSRMWLGGGIFVVGGVIGLIGALADPLASAPLAVINATVAVAAGLITLSMLLRIGPAEAPIGRAGSRGAATAKAIASMPDWDRRRFLIASAGTLVGAAVVGRYGRGAPRCAAPDRRRQHQQAAGSTPAGGAVDRGPDALGARADAAGDSQ